MGTMRYVVAMASIHQSDDAIIDLDSSTLWPISVDQTRSAKLVGFGLNAPCLSHPRSGLEYVKVRSPAALC